MSASLATKFGSKINIVRSEVPLTKSQLVGVAPSIFAAEPHESRSDRYTYIPTRDVLNGLWKEGFAPFMAVQSRSRIPGKGEFTKHMLRLRHRDQITASTEVPEIVLINSHDGTSSFQLLAGLFRSVCQNGLICGDSIEDFRVGHRGDVVNNVIEATYRIVDQFDAVESAKDIMKSATLALPEATAFAEAALALKYEEPSDSPISARQLLTTRRWDDRNADVWSVYNRVQENMIKGGLSGRDSAGRRTSTRAVTGIDTDVKLNRALWILAEQMAALKA